MPADLRGGGGRAGWNTRPTALSPRRVRLPAGHADRGGGERRGLLGGHLAPGRVGRDEISPGAGCAWRSMFLRRRARALRTPRLHGGGDGRVAAFHGTPGGWLVTALVLSERIAPEDPVWNLCARCTAADAGWESPACAAAAGLSGRSCPAVRRCGISWRNFDPAGSGASGAAQRPAEGVGAYQASSWSLRSTSAVSTKTRVFNDPPPKEKTSRDCLGDRVHSTPFGRFLCNVIRDKPVGGDAEIQRLRNGCHSPSASRGRNENTVGTGIDPGGLSLVD